MTIVSLVNAAGDDRDVTVASTGIDAAKEAKRTKIAETKDPTWRVLKYPERVVTWILGWVVVSVVLATTWAAWRTYEKRRWGS